MERIASFTVDHFRLEPGVYVSRKDQAPEDNVAGATAERCGDKVNAASDNAVKDANTADAEASKKTEAADRSTVSAEGAAPLCVVTTFDIRMTAPNREPVMDTAAVHAIEHLGATFLRNDDEWKESVLYFGPMGCRTGFYMLVFGDYEPRDVMPLLVRMFEFCRDFEGEVPGAFPQECGNYHDNDLAMAKWHSRRFLENTLECIDEQHTTYPQL